MKQSKKWISLALVCSQFLTTVPVSAILVGPENAKELTPVEEQTSGTLENQETRPSEPPEENQKNLNQSLNQKIQHRLSLNR